MQKLHWGFGVRLNFDERRSPDEILSLVEKHHLVVFDDCMIGTKHQFREYVSRFGRLYQTQDHLKINDELTIQHWHNSSQHDVNEITLETSYGASTSKHNRREWHFDGAAYASEQLLSFLTVRIDDDIPDTEIIGDTAFCYLKGIYESLSPAMQEFLCSLTSVHRNTECQRHDYIIARIMENRTDQTINEKLKKIIDFRRILPLDLERPAVTNGCLIWSPNGRPRFRELNEEENKMFYDFFYSKIKDLTYLYLHRWKKNQLVVYSNQPLLHAKADNASVEIMRTIWRLHPIVEK